MDIKTKLDGSEFDPELDLAEQLIADGAEEITRPGSFEEGLVVIRTVPFEMPAERLLRVTEANYNEVSKPTGAPCRWFRWPYRNRGLVLDAGHPDELLRDFNEEFARAIEESQDDRGIFGGVPQSSLAEMDQSTEDALPADATILAVEAPEVTGGVLGAIDEMPAVDEERTEP